VTAAAVMFLQGVDPVGVPFMAARDPLVREVWTAIAVRAGQLQKAARS
jgi:hypothetical protein